jgi:hypothetical protein
MTALASSTNLETFVLKPLFDKSQAAKKEARKFRGQADFVERL